METFLDNDDVQDLVLYAIGQIGENANAISDEMRDKYQKLQDVTNNIPDMIYETPDIMEDSI